MKIKREKEISYVFRINTSIEKELFHQINIPWRLFIHKKKHPKHHQPPQVNPIFSISNPTNIMLMVQESGKLTPVEVKVGSFIPLKKRRGFSTISSGDSRISEPSTWQFW